LFGRESGRVPAATLVGFKRGCKGIRFGVLLRAFEDADEDWMDEIAKRLARYTAAPRRERQAFGQAIQRPPY
jgi:hypothetical protein